MEIQLKVTIEFDSLFNEGEGPNTTKEWADFFAQHFPTDAHVIGGDEGNMVELKGWEFEPMTEP